MRQPLFQVPEVATRGSADVENGLSIKHTKDRVKKLHAEGIRGAFVGVHLLVTSGGFCVVLPLNFSSRVRISEPLGFSGRMLAKKRRELGRKCGGRAKLSLGISQQRRSCAFVRQHPEATCKWLGRYDPSPTQVQFSPRLLQCAFCVQDLELAHPPTGQAP